MITAAQMRVLKAVEGLLHAGVTPTYGQIASVTGLKSIANIHQHVHRLAEHGILALAGNGRKRIVGVVPGQSRNGLRWTACESGHQEILFQGRECPLCKSCGYSVAAPVGGGGNLLRNG